MILFNCENSEIKKGLFKSSIYLKGWAFDSEKISEIRVYDVKNQCLSNAKIRRTKRTDVYKYHNLNKYALNSGFEISVIDIHNTPKIILRFSDQEGVLIEDVELQTSEFHSDSISFNVLLKKTYNYIKIYGIFETIKKINSFLTNSKVDFQQTPEIYFFREDEYYMELSSDFTVIVNSTLCSSVEIMFFTINNIKSIGAKKILVIASEQEELKNFDMDEVQIIFTERALFSTKDIIKEAIHLFKKESFKGEYLIPINGGDSFSLNTLSYLQKYILETKYKIFTADEDRYFQGEYFSHFSKREYIAQKGLGRNVFRKMIAIHFDFLDKFLYEEISLDDIYVIDKVLYHYNVDFERKVEKVDIKPIAFYLPQFHTFPENDEWWGKGFTEWTNTRKGIPMFKNHYQPHEPGELGFYDLVKGDNIQEKQACLARQYGIYAFCYYYYWFEGKKLMEKPLERLLRDQNIDFPFLICWANETWSRRWDGQENEILIKQIHNEKTDEQFIDEMIPIFQDDRYIKIKNEPLFLVYRANLFPDLRRTIGMWKKKCIKAGFSGLRVALVQSFGLEDPREYGADYAVEFPPHNTAVTNITERMEDLNPNFMGNIYDYEELMNRNLSKQYREYVYYRGLMLGWDNTARRGYASHIYANFGPEKYLKWLVGLIDYTTCYYSNEDQYIFINAWNEWAEGTHLEPDEKNGRLFLELTQKALEANY